jgi:hypothetical protein
VVSQDALRTRFIENWCKVVQTGEHSKPLLRRGFWVYPPVRGLWRDGLLIRRLHVQDVPGVRRYLICTKACGARRNGCAYLIWPHLVGGLLFSVGLLVTLGTIVFLLMIESIRQNEKLRSRSSSRVLGTLIRGFSGSTKG